MMIEEASEKRGRRVVEKTVEEALLERREGLLEPSRFMYKPLKG